jgi:hypothetical protein
MSDCEHEWYPVKIEEMSIETSQRYVYRVCRKCWGYQIIASLWVR